MVKVKLLKKKIKRSKQVVKEIIKKYKSINSLKLLRSIYSNNLGKKLVDDTYI